MLKKYTCNNKISIYLDTSLILYHKKFNILVSKRQSFKYFRLFKKQKLFKIKQKTYLFLKNIFVTLLNYLNI